MKHIQEADAARMAPARYNELKRMLDERRIELQAAVKGKMRDVRAEAVWGGKQNEVLDAVESSEADIQEDIEFALIQMKSETLNKVWPPPACPPCPRSSTCRSNRRPSRRCQGCPHAQPST